MKDILILILLLAGITGVLNGIFLFFYLYLGYSKNNPANKYLAFLVLFLTIRMAKSIITSVIPVDFYIIHIGLTAFTAVGPMLFLYIRQSINPKLKFSKTELLHFIPALLVLLSSLLKYPQDDPRWDLRYNLIMLQLLIYLVLSGYSFFKAEHNLVLLSNKRGWYMLVILSVALIWVSYGITWWTGILPYLSGTFLFCIFVYLLLYLRSNKKQINESFEKYKNSILSKGDSRALFQKLKTLMEDSKPYLDNEITLSKLSEALDTKPYLLSQVINENFSTNFFDFINSYRIDEVKERLVSPEFSKLTIAAIAYDCGFNSISSFNSAFKKKENVSPGKYREEHLK